MITRRRLLKASTAAVFAPALLPRSAGAQGAGNWPNRFVRLIVPFPPGGGTDNVARVFAPRLGEVWGQQIVIENRAGAGSNIGTELAAKADPDGYTILFATVAIAINRHLHASLGYDAIKDFAPITTLADYPNILGVAASSPIKSVADLVEASKKKPGMLFGSSGIGTSPHLSGELFKRMAGLDMTHVPYRGAGPAVVDLIGGRLDFMFNTMGAMLPHVKGGRVRALAVSSPKRFYSVPDMPTVAESGVPGFEVMGWYALLAPAKTPPEIVRKMNTDVVAVLNEPAIRQRIEDLGLAVVANSQDETAAMIRKEIAKWEPVIREGNIKAE